MKSKYVIELDDIQKSVYSFLKMEGFKKTGRSFNKETENGIFEVITFQMGQFPIGKNWEVSGLRPNLYGKFTINMGVYIDEIYSFKFPQIPPKVKKEHHYTFRTRLGTLINGRDYWWELKGQTAETSEELIMYFQELGLNWFKEINTRNKIEKQDTKEQNLILL